MKVSLSDNLEILEHEVLQAIQPRISRLIWAGPFPSTLESTAKEQFEEVLYNDKDIKEALKDGQERMEQDMESSDFISVEEQYENSEDFE